MNMNIPVIEEGRLIEKDVFEILEDMARASSCNISIATDKLNSFFDWAMEYIDSREWAPTPESGYLQDFLCPLYHLPGYSILPLHIKEDTLEAMVALEEV